MQWPHGSQTPQMLESSRRLTARQGLAQFQLREPLTFADVITANMRQSLGVKRYRYHRDPKDATDCSSDLQVPSPTPPSCRLCLFSCKCEGAQGASLTQVAAEKLAVPTHEAALPARLSHMMACCTPGGPGLFFPPRVPNPPFPSSQTWPHF